MVTMHVSMTKVDSPVLWAVHLCKCLYLSTIYMIFDRFVRDPAPQFPAKLVRGCAMYGGNDLVLNDGVPHSLWTYLSQISFFEDFSHHLPFPTQFFGQALQLAQWS